MVNGVKSYREVEKKELQQQPDDYERRPMSFTGMVLM